MEVTQHDPGRFSWADLATPDAKGSRMFYTELLGLDATEIPVGEGAVYVILSKSGKNACAIYEMSEEIMRQTGRPPAWQSYFTVRSADDTASHVKKLGGTLVQEPFDVMQAGRMAVAQDPTGAVFAVWQPVSEIGAHVFGEPGALGWTELHTHETEAASRFYSALFGWSVDKMPGTHAAEYSVFQMDGNPAAGMMAIDEERGQMPANWVVYFVVESLDATVTNAKSMGATGITPPMDAEGVGRYVYLRDPQGVYVAFIEVEHRPE